MNEMTMEQVEERIAQIGIEAETADEATLDKLTEERNSLEERKKEILVEIEERKKDIAEVMHRDGEKINIEEKKKTMNMEEIRSSKAYINAFANYIKSNDDTEVRALLTDNVESPLVGSVPVPTFVEGIIADAYRQSKIMSRVRKTFAKGNVKIGFEVSASDAEAHEEGGDPIDEEELVLGIVTLIPSTLKKWVSISDESLDSMSGEAYLRYVYTEIMRKIVATEEKMVILAIENAPETATATSPAVPVVEISEQSLADFINLRAQLTAEASDLVIICTPQQYADYKALAISAGFAFDPFEGIEVIFNDNPEYPILGDLSGILANYPNGDTVQFKYDDTTLMTSDLVRILGRKPVAIGLVGNNYFARLTGDGEA